MSQYGKGTHVRNQPQFDILSPLYSNPHVWPGAEFVRGHNGWEAKAIPRADLEGLVGGDPMLADGNIIWRFVWVHSFMPWVAYGFLISHDNHMCRQWNAARTVRQATTINSMWRGMRFRAQCKVPFDLVCFSCMRIMPSPYQILRGVCFVWLSGFSTWAPNGVGITCTFFLSIFFNVLSLCYFDVSHDSNGWRSIRIGVGGKD